LPCVVRRAGGDGERARELRRRCVGLGRLLRRSGAKAGGASAVPTRGFCHYGLGLRHDQLSRAAFWARFFLKSSMALLMASSANTEQWIFTGGRFSSSAIWLFFSSAASSTLLPLIHSVASDDDAMAEPQPNVLN